MRVLSDDSNLCEKWRDGVTMIVYAVVDETISPTSPLGDAIESFSGARMPSASSRRSTATTRSSRSRCGSRNESSRPAALLRRKALAGLRGPRYERNRETLFFLL